MQSLAFKQVDVFTEQRYKGNPVAVILQAGDLTTEQMQQIANWTNLSETTFVLPATQPGADYRVRIFTPSNELPFAGHPTIGTAHALLEAGLIQANNGQLVQECAAGLINLQVTRQANGAQWIAFELPQPDITPVTDAELDELQAILGAPVLREHTPCVIDVGPRWLIAQMRDAQTVLSVMPDFSRMSAHDHRARTTGIVIFGAYPTGNAEHIEVRAFAPTCGPAEDPVCGSGNGAVAAFIRATGQTATLGHELLASQGAALGRAGKLRLSISDNAIKVAGAAVTCLDGHLTP